jgi:hypothetical protein
MGRLGCPRGKRNGRKDGEREADGRSPDVGSSESTFHGVPLLRSLQKQHVKQGAAVDSADRGAFLAEKVAAVDER